MEFLERHVEELLEAGLVCVNNSSRYASPPRVIPKVQPRDYRMTVDTWAVNALTEPLLWPMPHLEVAITLLDGARVFFTLDWLCMSTLKELFTIMGHRGMVTPTRVLMGGTDSVGYYQSVVEEIFQPYIYHGLLAWLDDILGYAKTEDEYMGILEKRLVSIWLEPATEQVQVLPGLGEMCRWSIALPTPCRRIDVVTFTQSAADIQRFLCVTNWMGQSIPKYSELVAPLIEIVDKAAKEVSSRKAKKLAKMRIAECGWTQQHDAVFEDVKKTLLEMVPLAHPDQNMTVCLFCDPSQDFWGAVCTQLPESELSKPLEEQNHRPLAFLISMTNHREGSYLLLRPKGFHLLTDHRNLVYISDPYATDTGMQRYQADKLQRWTMTLMAYRYVEEHVKGDENVWADILSRSSGLAEGEKHQVSRISALGLVSTLSPRTTQYFQWPSLTEISALQQLAERPEEVQ
ncbi:LOW QUALITY PROTEIN: hypothetical protein PHPALM_31012 [Phytophthora palmivora]|uniref:Reverse transcriptase/retrotransposon-derived protein RNase H-like domain-containing protein n=1 Tax=Phytophthora palmivora TaxID=4796 RepID=A0A2P4X3N0_9STRA|nr:LOW QUALITY PROTEIN: hypothetical protein PHPALM_31012 [Phytophthora palmivora]